MSLSDRIARTRPEVVLPDDTSVINDAELSIVRRIVVEVRERLSEAPNRLQMTDERLRVVVEGEVNSIIDSSDLGIPTTRIDRIRIAAIDDLLGFGLLQEFLNNPTVTEIMVNGPNLVFIESGGVIQKTSRTFESDDQLRRVIDRMVRTSGRRVDQASPMVDARLPDGSRLNVILPPLSVDGPSVTIRKFTSSWLTTEDLVLQGSLSRESAEFLEKAVNGKLNILVSGGTGTGKTTILNILSSFIGRNERVVTIEDAVELSLHIPNLVRLESRPANSEGAGEVDIRDLVRNSLRMRPDRIVVGEVRGSETIDMLQAMNTGHEGSLSTVHANSPRDALRRLETMVLLGGVELPLRAIREQVASSIDLVVHLVRDPLGRRFISTVTEIVGMESDVISTADLFARGTTGLDGATDLSPLLATAVTSRRLGTRGNRMKI